MSACRMLMACGLATAAAITGVVAATGPGASSRDNTAWLHAQLAQAPSGSTVHVPPGVYRGPFTVERPLQLVGGGHATLRGNGTGNVVQVRAADVTIEGFHVAGSGLDLAKDQAAIHITGVRAVVRYNSISESLHGVYVRQADGARIEHNTIVGTSHTLELVDPLGKGAGPAGSELCEVALNQNRRGNGVHIWDSSGHVVANNVIRETRDGIYFSFTDHTEVRDNHISQVRYGLHYMYSDANRFHRNVFRDNAAGAALMYSKGIVLRENQFVANRSHRAYGILLQSVDDTQLIANRIDGNTMGVFVENSHGNVFRDNHIVGNHVGVHVSDSSDENGFSGNRFVGNLHTVETSGGNQSNLWAIDGRGNYWDGAVRIDLDHDGIGDLPHRELDLFGATRRAFPAIGLLAGSPGERLLRFVHTRLALPGLPGILDPAPLVSEGRP